MNQLWFRGLVALVGVQLAWGCAALPETVIAASRLGLATDTAAVDVGSIGGGAIALRLLPPDDAQGFRQFGLLDVEHHWTAADIFLYTATLTAWDGSAFVAIGAGVSTSLNPKAVTPQTQAAFTNLKQGTRYQVSVVAAGNIGGTAGTTTLNNATPTHVPFDFSSAQDVQDTLSAAATVTLDPVPFSGTVTLAEANVPTGTTHFELTLVDVDTASTVISDTFLVGQGYQLSSLKLGIHYQVSLSANSEAGPLATAQSAQIYYDPTLQDLEQAQTVSVGF